MSPVRYLLRMPDAVPAGKILIHNRGRPTSRLGSRAFRAWFDEPSDRYEPCTCGWAANLPGHYQVRGRGSAVPAERTRGEIEAMLADYGAGHFAYVAEAGGAAVVFEAQGLRLRFDVPLERGSSARAVRSYNQRWREFLTCIKAKLDSVTTGIESFTEAFLAHVVMADGRTVFEHVAPEMAQFALAGSMPAPASGGNDQRNPDR